MEMTEVLYRRMPGRLQPLSTKVVKLRKGLQASPLVQSFSGGPPPCRGGLLHHGRQVGEEEKIEIRVVSRKQI